MHNQSNRDILHNCKRNKKQYVKQKLHLNARRRTLHLVQVGATNNGNSLVDPQHVLLHRFSVLSNFIQGVDHGVVLVHVTKLMVHALQKLGHHQVRASLQGMHPSDRDILSGCCRYVVSCSPPDIGLASPVHQTSTEYT